MKETPKLSSYEIQPENYDLLILGTPVWAGSYAPVIRSFIRNHFFQNQKFALFCTYRGQAMSALDKLTELVSHKDNQVITQMDIKEEILKKPDQLNQKVDEFINMLNK
ncbi:hypothetical protein V2B37_14960 [Natranaerobius thermophilus JW/NM-WN-LF]